MTSEIMRLITCVAFSLSSCGPSTSITPGEESTTRAWPQKLAARNLQTITGDFALYGNDVQATEKLQRWVDIQICRFQTRYGEGVQTGPGLILAIEPGKEPFSAIETWRERNQGDRGTLPTWASRIGGLFSTRATDRPYARSRTPYFRESFSIPYEDACDIGILNENTPRPAWICLLTTDAQLDSAFDEQVMLSLQRHWERVKKVPFLVRAANLPAMVVWTPIRWLSLSECRSIDRRLMQLDRREALFSALIFSRFDVPDRCEALDKELRVETDKRWMRLWKRRPRD